MKEYFTRYQQIRGRRRTTPTCTARCSARGAPSSVAGTPPGVKACPSRRGSKTAKPRAAHALLETIVREWRLCYVPLVEGCTRCQDRPRPTREEWERQLMNWALSEDKRRWLGRCDQACKDLEVAASYGGGRASGVALAVAREVLVTCGGGAVARSGEREQGLVVAHEIGDVIKKAATGLPRILCRARGTASGTLAVGASVVINQALHDVSPHPQAAGVHLAGTEFAAALLGSERTDALEHLTPQQYRLMVHETDQARDDAIEAQNLAESARVRAAAAEAAATRSERLRHLESLGCGAPRSATP
ncbi:hypothetical protein PR003_g17810 [Phytophthora rubi]|uniref:Uncharacterized protein n=1 Tax=Phytophthora rubi TaxID=129364 RepID=A0A6A4EJL7_9STRA|nr:hypothetical protein PR003_g17810 [Phytophthora rubi]